MRDDSDFASFVKASNDGRRVLSKLGWVLASGGVMPTKISHAVVLLVLLLEEKYISRRMFPLASCWRPPYVLERLIDCRSS